MMILATLLALHPFAAGSDSGSEYHLKLWGCSSDDPTKVSYQNQHFIVNATSHTINFPKSDGCITSSSYQKAAPGSALHISPCSSACAPEQGWNFDASTGLLKSTTMKNTCIGVKNASQNSKSDPPPKSLVLVTAQRCDETSSGVDLKWEYDAKFGHLKMGRKCIDAGQGVISLINSHAAPALSPSGQGCLSPIAKALPYCDTSLPVAKRVADIVSRMTIEEKTAHIWGSGSHGDNTTFPGVPRLGLPPFDWGLEGLHGLRTSCLPSSDPNVCVDPNSPTPEAFACPTVFPAPTGLGATFNDALVHDIGVAIGTEARAMNNMGGHASGRLVVRTPEINLIRDPRWGRNVENPTEDPTHAGKYGAAMVSGVQKMVDGVMLAGTEMKHYAVYQVEDCGAVPAGHGPGIPTDLPSCSRMNFDANLSAAELNESYFPAFRATVLGAAPTGVMCSYNSINGVPACASKMLSDTIRGWGFTGYVGTDCSAADNIFKTYHFAEDLAHGYAVGLNSGGYDLICHPSNFSALTEAVSGKKLVTVSALDRAVTNAFTVLFQVGVFSPLDSSAVFRIGLEQFGSKAHAATALKAARQSTVLLRNEKNALPLASPPKMKRGTKIVVVGPQANATGMLGGNYFDSECAEGSVIWNTSAGGGGQLSWWPCVPTLFDAVKRAVATSGSADADADGPTVAFAQGCRQRCSGKTDGDGDIYTKASEDSPDVCSPNDRAGIPAAAAAAKDADVVVLGLGFDTAIAGEGHDRLDMALPGAQQELALAVLAAASKEATVVLVLYAAAAVSLDALLAAPRPPDAILAGHMPGASGGTAVAEALFGEHNDFGKLPYTVYPHAYQNATKFVEMSLRQGKDTPEGRTHRFYTGVPQFSYGEGLSYTSFALNASTSSPTHRPIQLRSADATRELSIAVTLTNTGAEHAGSTVVLAWFAPKRSSDHHRVALATRLGQEPPQRSLAAYARSPSLRVGEHATVELKVRVDDLAFVDAATAERVLPAGEYEVRVDLGPKNEDAGEIVRAVHILEDIAL